MVDALVAGTGLHDRGLREVRLYSLEPARNGARYRCLLELGDNAADRAFLESDAGREKVADALAAGIRAFGPKP
jgi:N-acetylmuramoyl-L-alanine amidase